MKYLSTLIAVVVVAVLVVAVLVVVAVVIIVIDTQGPALTSRRCQQRSRS